ASGSNVFSQSGIIADFNTRSDFDITLQWRLQNMGLGNLWQIREARAAHEQTVVFQLQTQDLVVSQVVRALEEVVRARQRLDVVRAGLFDAQDRPNGVVYASVRLNFQRLKGAESRPLEVLDSVRRLFDTLETYSFALTDYDRARFRLLIALGMSPAALLDPRCMPAPPLAPKPPPANAPAPAGTSQPRTEDGAGGHNPPPPPMRLDDGPGGAGRRTY